MDLVSSVASFQPCIILIICLTIAGARASALCTLSPQECLICELSVVTQWSWAIITGEQTQSNKQNAPDLNIFPLLIPLNFLCLATSSKCCTTVAQQCSVEVLGRGDILKQYFSSNQQRIVFPPQPQSFHELINYNRNTEPG